MAHEHTHTHEHEHEHEHSEDLEAPAIGKLDPAERSLSEALRISFIVLKVIMAVLVVAFLASGFKTVGPGEAALVLRFGAIRTMGPENTTVLGPGAHWVFPYPIDELVKFPVGQPTGLAIDTFWYSQTQDDILGSGPRPQRPVPEKLNPLTEGYCLTRSQRGDAQPPSVTPSAQRTVAEPNAISRRVAALQTEGSDYNIVHTRWQINYQIDNIERFFRNVYVRDIAPGQLYSDVMKESVAPLLKDAVDDAVVAAMVHHTIDEALVSTDTIRRHVAQLAQQKLDDIESGIRLTSVLLVDVKWPKQVNDTFEAYVSAKQTSAAAITEAGKYKDKTLQDTAGRVAEPLYEALTQEKPNEQDIEDLWSQAAGQVQDRMARAQAQSTVLVDSAKARASYLASLLPEYRKRPLLVLNRLYLDAIEQVFNDVDDKWVLEPTNGIRGREIRLMLNRDPTAKPKQPAQSPAAAAAPR
jgi:regulator of protease activity HflC (stomatin/prohibitin superfamily)